MKKIIFPGIAMIGVTYALARYSYGLLLPYISKDLSFSDAYAGVPGFLAYAAYCLSLILAPLVIRSAGVYNTVQLAGLSAITGMIGISFSKSIATLSISTFIAGFASGLSSPAYGQAVTDTLPEEKQDKANTWINTGTSFGLIISGPMALLFAKQWRITYLFFVIVGTIVLFWNHRNIPRVRNTIEAVCCKREREVVSCKEVMALSLAALIIGICASIYWVFSKSFLTAVHGMSEIESSFFWILMGISGSVGGIAGGIIEKYGLTISYRGSLLVMIISICLIVIPLPISVYCSAFFFGVTFIFLTGLFIVWGISLFVQEPSFGVSLAFLLLGIGQSFGSLFAGIIIENTSYRFAFLLYAGIGLGGLLLRAHVPARNNV